MKRVNFQDGVTKGNADTFKQLEDNIEEEIENKNTYSTNEQKIGTWINGKPLYRKVVTYFHNAEIGAEGEVTNISIPHNISNLEQCFKVNCTVSGGFIVPLISSNNGTAITAGAGITKIDNININLRIVNDRWSNRTWYIILEYTKTTD